MNISLTIANQQFEEPVRRLDGYEITSAKKPSHSVIFKQTMNKGGSDMSYKHILVAVDLSEDSKLIVDKAVALAKPLEAKVSFIHIDINYAAETVYRPNRYQHGGNSA